MGKVDLNQGAGDAPRRAVLRSDRMQVARVFLPAGESPGPHSHPEEETVFVEGGRLEVTLGEGEEVDTYVVEQGQASFHASGVPHRLRALDDTWMVSFKNLVEPPRDSGMGRLE